MRPGNPKQHVHKWELAFTKMSGFEPLPKYYEGMDSPGGFYAKKYWKCIRGNKIKHTYAIPEPKFDYTEYKSYTNVFVMASGIGYSQHVKVD